MKAIIVSVTLLFFSGFFSQVFGGPQASQELQRYLQQKEKEVRIQNAAFKGFSTQRGKLFYLSKQKHRKSGELRSCTTCHQVDPKTAGETHVGKPVEPIAPVANQTRFKDIEKIEKWFRRNCSWVLERPCTNQEKGDFITYLFSVQ